jgi:hypothetical protein
MSFDWATGYTSLWLSAATYCDPGSYYTRTFSGYAAGFVITKRIGSANQNWYSAEGFIGYRPDDSNIYVVFQGSNTIQQWVNNARFKKVTFPWCSVDDYYGKGNPCEVHSGFWSAQQNVNSLVLNEVSRLIQLYPKYGIICTGHSLGGALATLQAVEIIMRLNLPVKLFSFGAPREFNNQASSWVSDHIPNRNRVTHYMDPAPHMPTQGGFIFPVYRHISGEWYEQHTADGTNIFKACSGFEDSTCADQWKITIPEHHHYYLGYPLECRLATMPQSSVQLQTTLVPPPERVQAIYSNGTYNQSDDFVFVGNISYSSTCNCNCLNEGVFIAGWVLFGVLLLGNIVYFILKTCCVQEYDATLLP